MASARRLVQEESRRRGASSFAPPPAQAPASAASPLAQAMTRSRPGEKMLPGGILQVTTPGGATYCLQTPPGIADPGLTPRLAVATNCP